MPSIALRQRGWEPTNHRLLEAWLNRPRGDSRPAVAVFDWDNTSIFHDAGEAVMRHQLAHLAFRLSPDELAALLPLEVAGIERVPPGVSLADARADLLEAYTALWPNMAAGRADTVRGTPAHLDFRTRMAWLYAALEETDGIGATYSYPWLVAWLAGYTAREVQEVAKQALAACGEEPFGQASWSTATPGRAGHVRFPFTTGVAAQPEIKDLMGTLGEAGIDVYVVTASHQELVRGAAAAFDYPVPTERIFGMRLEEASGGRFLPRVVREDVWPSTYRAGKRRVIAEHLPAPPLLVAGDSDTDFEMLTGFPETEVRLVIHRAQSGDIATLYGDASMAETTTGRLTLLQGRDEPKGCFCPSRTSVPLAAPQAERPRSGGEP